MDDYVDEVQVLIVADNMLSRTGLTTLMADQSGCLIVGQTSGGKALLNNLALYEPDVLLYLMDWNTENGIEDLSGLEGNDPPVVVLVQDEERTSDIVAAMRSDVAYGLLVRDSDPEMIVSALSTVHNGLIVLDPLLAPALIQKNTPSEEPLPEALTTRENDVLQLLSQGLTNKAIAHTLSITDHTVKFHVTAIMTKLSAQSRTEAVVRATRLGLIIL